MTKPYKVTATGTYYDARTNDLVINALESARQTKTRVRIWYGDTITGKSWGDEFGMTGTISRSTGVSKIPLMIDNARSTGGPGLLDHCIVRIDLIYSGRTLYQHQKFHTPKYELAPAVTDGYVEAVTADGELTAQFKKPGQAQRWIDFMTGKRYAK